MKHTKYFTLIAVLLLLGCTSHVRNVDTVTDAKRIAFGIGIISRTIDVDHEVIPINPNNSYLHAGCEYGEIIDIIDSGWHQLHLHDDYILYYINFLSPARNPIRNWVVLRLGDQIGANEFELLDEIRVISSDDCQTLLGR